MGDESWRLMREDPNKFYTEATDLCIGIKKLLYLFKLMKLLYLLPGYGGVRSGDKKSPPGFLCRSPGGRKGRLSTFPLSQYHRRGEV